MDALIYLLGLIVLILLPILLCIVVIIAGYTLYIRYKVKKNLEDFSKDADKMNESFSKTYTRTTQQTHRENVIDVEYTEHDAEDV